MKQNKKLHKKLHIFHVLFTNKVGGLEQAYLDYTWALILCGHRVTAVVAPDAPYIHDLAKLPKSSMEIITLKARGFYDVFAWWRLRKMLLKVNPDVVLAHNGRAIFTAWGALLGLQTPLVGVSHSNNFKYSKKADNLLVLTEAMRARFLAAGYPPSKCAVMNNMIELLAKSENLRKWEKNNPPIVGFLGRLSPEKGADDLLRAVAVLKEKNLILHLKIGGTGQEEESLRALTKTLGIEAQVEFCGWVANENKAEFFANIDVLCVPSINESFGLVVLEAWKYNVPIIASDAEGPAELICCGENGLLYPKGNAQELAKNIEKLLFGDDSLAQKLIENGKKSVEKYGMEESAKRLEKLLNLAIAQ